MVTVSHIDGTSRIPGSVFHRTHARSSLACVVPASNEAEQIGDFLEQLHRSITQFDADIGLIVVNDGSTDREGAEVLRAARYAPVHYIELSRNFGKELALQAGLDAAHGLRCVAGR